jgi:hypothetical protein
MSPARKLFRPKAGPVPTESAYRRKRDDDVAIPSRRYLSQPPIRTIFPAGPAWHMDCNWARTTMEPGIPLSAGVGTVGFYSNEWGDLPWTWSRNSEANRISFWIVE